MNIVYNSVVFLSKTTFGLGRLTVRGKENVPRTGPFIVVSNHLSNGDPAAVIAAVPRHLHIMAKKSLFAGPVFTKMWTSMGLYPLERSGRDMKALIWAIHVLKHGEPVLFFPEGTRSLDRKMQKGKTGAAYTALKANVPILPVAVTGTEHISSMIGVLFPLCRTSATVGKPFTLPKPDGRITHELLEDMTDIIMERIATLLPEQYRGYYADRVRSLEAEPPDAETPSS